MFTKSLALVKYSKVASAVSQEVWLVILVGICVSETMSTKAKSAFSNEETKWWESHTWYIDRDVDEEGDDLYIFIKTKDDESSGKRWSFRRSKSENFSMYSAVVNVKPWDAESAFQILKVRKILIINIINISTGLDLPTDGIIIFSLVQTFKCTCTYLLVFDSFYFYSFCSLILFARNVLVANLITT